MLVWNFRFPLNGSRVSASSLTNFAWCFPNLVSSHFLFCTLSFFSILPSPNGVNVMLLECKSDPSISKKQSDRCYRYSMPSHFLCSYSSWSSERLTVYFLHIFHRLPCLMIKYLTHLQWLLGLPFSTITRLF